MIILKLSNPHWSDKLDGLDDQCIHGQIIFQINDITFVNTSDGDLSPTTAALYLLRSLENDHTGENSLTSDSNSNIFPECGFTVWVNKGELLIMGCENGINCDIVHADGKVRISNINGVEEVEKTEWLIAVINFAQQISAFYGSQKSKNIIEDKTDREGWELFWKEYNELLNKHSAR